MISVYRLFRILDGGCIIMSKAQSFELNGTIKKIVQGGKFIVSVPTQSRTIEIEAHPSGKIRVNSVNLAVGDKVKVEVSAYDPFKGRIMRRIY